MQYFNHYSAPILAAVLLAGGLSLVLRRGGKMRQWLVLGGAMVALGAAWWMFRPVATTATAVAGLPWLLEVQSPYCLGCVAIKPAVDRLERELQGRLALRRVDIQSAEGRKLADQYGIELTPTFIFFDSSGQEQWRSVGHLDAARVQTSLQPLAKGAGNRPPGRDPTACTLGLLLAEVNARTRNSAVFCPRGKLVLENRTVKPPTLHPPDHESEIHPALPTP